MQAKDVIDLIKNDVLGVKNNQQNVIDVDAMVNYLDNLKGSVEGVEQVDQKTHESNLAQFRAEHERGIVHYEAQHRSQVELFRSVITYGSAAMKSAMIINGAAAVALLAFIGNIWAKGIEQDAVGSLTASIILFSLGVLTAAISSMLSYFTQFFYSKEFMHTGVAFHTLTVVCVIGSFIFFTVGSIQSYQAFNEHLAPDPVSVIIPDPAGSQKSIP